MAKSRFGNFLRLAVIWLQINGYRNPSHATPDLAGGWKCKGRQRPIGRAEASKKADMLYHSQIITTAMPWYYLLCEKGWYDNLNFMPTLKRKILLTIVNAIIGSRNSFHYLSALSNTMTNDMKKIHSFIAKLFCSRCCHFLSKLPSYEEEWRICLLV